jgi:dolichyl-phosphate beta-glucosyltransferase
VTSASMPRIAVIMPAYNEADRIGPTLESVARYRSAGDGVSRVVLADDGSTDRTVEIAEVASRRLGLPMDIIRLPHRGKASTVRSAMLQVAATTDVDYLMMLDADNELQVDQLDRVAWSYDPRTIYIGRRSQAAPADRHTSPPPFRRIMSGVMRIASRLLLGVDFRDTQSGFKLFPRAIAADLFGQQRSTSWTFDAELLLIAQLSEIPIREVDVTWSPQGRSKVGPTAAISSAFALLGTAVNRVRGVYRPILRPMLAPTADRADKPMEHS